MLSRLPDSDFEQKSLFHKELQIKQNVLPQNLDFSRLVNDIISGKFTISVWGTEFDVYEDVRTIIGKNGLELQYLPIQEYRIFCILMGLKGASISIRDFYMMLRGDLLKNADEDFIFKEGILPELKSLNKRFFGNMPINVLKIEGNYLSLNSEITIPQRLPKATKVPKKVKTIQDSIQLDVSALDNGLVRWILEEINKYPKGVRQEELIKSIVAQRSGSVDATETEEVLLSGELEDTLEEMGYKIIVESGSKLLILKALS